MNGEKTELKRQILDFLNRTLALDPLAVNTLMKSTVGCNSRMADDEFVQVGVSSMGYTLRPVGLLCGLSEFLTGEKICVVVDGDKQEIIRFDSFA